MTLHERIHEGSRRHDPPRGSWFGLVALTALLCLLAAMTAPVRVNALSSPSGETSGVTGAARTVLLLHTGHRGAARTDSLSEALRKALAEADAPPQIDEAYLDWFRYPDEERLQLLTRLLVRQYAADPPDLIIATGGKALSYALTLRLTLGGSIPVVHAGVPRGTATRESQYMQQVTGIPDTLDISGTAGLMKSLQPALERVVILHDGSENGLAVLDEALPVFKALDVVPDSIIHQNVMVHSQLHQQIRDAQKNNEFQVHYQPKCLPDGTVRGFEALLRWQTASGDYIPPGRFIPCAEETGVILLLGDMVLRESCRFAKRLRDEGLHEVTISVNVSVIQLTSSGYLERVLGIIEEEQVPRDAIVLEITESVLMESIDANVSRLEAMKAAGLRLSLDDFGTGYSSLTYLTQLPIEELKIDKSFIQQLDDNSVNASILSTVITLAGNLGLRTVAEGVETTVQRDFLVDHRCDLMQGYLYSPALPREDALLFTRKGPRSQEDNAAVVQWGNEPFY